MEMGEIQIRPDSLPRSDTEAFLTFYSIKLTHLMAGVFCKRMYCTVFPHFQSLYIHRTSLYVLYLGPMCTI